MTIDQALLQLVGQVAAVTSASASVFWGIAPEQTVAPYVILKQSGGMDGVTHDGPDSLRSMRVWIDCYAPSFARARAIRRGINDALAGQKITVSNVSLQSIIHQNSIDFIETEAAAEDDRFRCMTDLLIQYTET